MVLLQLGRFRSCHGFRVSVSPAPSAPEEQHRFERSQRAGGHRNAVNEPEREISTVTNNKYPSGEQAASVLMEGRAELYLQRSSSIQVGGDCGSAPFTSEDVTQGGGEGWRKAAADDGGTKQRFC
uniref:Uncharacterized protein n=1 Tax=Nothobranchius furzeri TaxID=105023 RepID=A0A1A7ZYI1_NOTFU